MAKVKIKDLTIQDLNMICSNTLRCNDCPLRFINSSTCWRSKLIADKDFQRSNFDIEKEIEVDDYF